VIDTPKAIKPLKPAATQGDQVQGGLPNKDAARKVVYLALQQFAPQWTRTRHRTTAPRSRSSALTSYLPPATVKHANN
jgi:transposase-like protein